MLHPQQECAGFTRLECATVIAGLGLLALIAVPVLATSLNDSHRAVCANNLRQLGGGLLGWTGDHGGAVPWRMPNYLGGTHYNPKSGNAWLEFAALSNYVSPRVITCPADLFTSGDVVVSPDWPALLLNRQNSVSYQLNLDVGIGWQDEAELVSSDRNTRFDGSGVGCSSGIGNAHLVRTSSDTSVFGWTNAVHGLSGHALKMDGTVEFTPTARLRALVDQNTDGGSCHFLNAR